MQVATHAFRFRSADGQTHVYAKIWAPDRPPVFVVQIVHGMIEYIERYDEFARYLCSLGAVVYGHDHLGHGRTASEQGLLGHFADRNGHKMLVEDIRTLNEIAHQNHPDLPLVLFGHSMGSILARQYAVQYGTTVDAVILSGTAGANSLAGAAMLLASIAKIFGRGQRPGNLLTHLAFEHYNDRIEDAQTPNDWLTRDQDVVRRYNSDPFNSFKLTNSAWHDFMRILRNVTGLDWSRQLRRDIGYLLISGDLDPVGDYGKGVRQVAQWMQDAGIEDITLHLYEQARHELTNEINREEVFRDIRDWIGERIDLDDI